MNDKITITAQEYKRLLGYGTAFNVLISDIIHQHLIKKPNLEKLLNKWAENEDFKDLIAQIMEEEKAYIVKCEQMGLL
jgi:predicted CopG family antitoxin